MGKALQIRVSASTWDVELLEKLWPALFALMQSIPVRQERQGVLEMVQTLDEGLRFMNWPQTQKDALAPGIGRCAQLKNELEEALANWDPRTANALSDTLEDELDKLEQACLACTKEKKC